MLLKVCLQVGLDLGHIDYSININYSHSIYLFRCALTWDILIIRSISIIHSIYLFRCALM
jgi:hypothetical protein